MWNLNFPWGSHNCISVYQAAIYPASHLPPQTQKQDTYPLLECWEQRLKALFTCECQEVKTMTFFQKLQSQHVPITENAFKGDEGDGGTGQCRDQGTASEWTFSNNCALGSPCIPTIITLFPWSSYSTMLLFELWWLLCNHTLSETLWGRILLCPVNIQSFFHARSTLNLQDRHVPWHRKGASFLGITRV